MRVAYLVAVVCLASLVGCGGTDDDVQVTDEGNTISFETVEFDVPPGDYFECFYTNTFTDRELSVMSATGSQGPGGHHILVFYTDMPREPTHHECDDSEMSNWHQIAGAAGQDVGGEVLGLKDDLALKVPKGMQLVLQAHYINTTGAVQKSKDKVTLNLLEPEEVSSYVSYFITFDELFEVPPNGKYEHTTRCTVEQDLQIVVTLGHLHEEGRHYQLDIVDEEDQVLQNLRTDVWTPEFTSHPPITYYPMADPLMLTKGMRLRQTCKWDNSTPEPLLFPREMCLSFMYYYPAAGDLTCHME